MGALLDRFNNKFLPYVESEVEKKCHLDRLASTCDEATREIRREIITSWDGDFNWGTTDAATQYDQKSDKAGSIRSGKLVYTVTTDSKIPSERFTPNTLNHWYFSHHSGYGDGREWVLGLLMDSGIIGLPDWGNYTARVAGAGPLEAFFDSSGIWQTFEGRVLSKL